MTSRNSSMRTGGTMTGSGGLEPGPGAARPRKERAGGRRGLAPSCPGGPYFCVARQPYKASGNGKPFKQKAPAWGEPEDEPEGRHGEGGEDGHDHVVLEVRKGFPKHREQGAHKADH